MWDWDETKRRANLVKHGVDFAEVDRLDWDHAVTREDTRGAYGERRFVSTVPLGGRLHVCVWTLRDGAPRLISLRRANPREIKTHAAQKLH